MCLSGACSLHTQPEPKSGLKVLVLLPLLVLLALIYQTAAYGYYAFI